MYFRLGGGTLKGISKPGHIVWSRVFVMDGKLHCDLGVAEVVACRKKKPNAAGAKPRRNGQSCMRCSRISRDQMMARHKSNHIQVVYAPNAKQAHRACRSKPPCSRNSAGSPPLRPCAIALTVDNKS